MAHFEGKVVCCSCPDGTCDMNCGMYRIAAGKPSNADRIRAMTDEELAEFIGGDPMHDICPSDCFEDPDRPCKVCVLKWLKQEGE